MDRITHDIRRSNWLEILNRSQQRPVHTTIKQWCLDNGISEKSYYYWQRKFRQEAAGQVSVPSATDIVDCRIMSGHLLRNKRLPW